MNPLITQAHREEPERISELVLNQFRMEREKGTPRHAHFRQREFAVRSIIEVEVNKAIAQAEQRGYERGMEESVKLVKDYGDSLMVLLKTESKPNTPYHLRSQGTLKGCAIGAERIEQVLRTKLNESKGEGGK